MKLHFTKMQGAGNDFVVLDATQQALNLTPDQLRFLGDRRFGVGADQILVVEPADSAEVDFRYRIFNGATGAEVEHCGNGARCFVRFVHEQGLSQRNPLRVQTMNKRLSLLAQADGRVTVDMSLPVFDHDAVAFDAADLTSNLVGHMPLWPLADAPASLTGWPDDASPEVARQARTLQVAVLSMGNPHAVMVVDHLDTAPVGVLGPWVETHPRFLRKVNVGFMQVQDRGCIHLRVHERDAGETLACGTGACAAVVAGIKMGLLDEQVDVVTAGGVLTIAWRGEGHPVWMTGPAQTVFSGEIEL